MGLLERGLVTEDQARVRHRWMTRRWVAIYSQTIEVLPRKIHQMVMLQIAGGSDQYVRGRIIPAIVVLNLFAIEVSYGLFGAEDRLPQRMVFPEIAREDLVQEVFRI